MRFQSDATVYTAVSALDFTTYTLPEPCIFLF
jgi:hypothetical protein